MSNPIPPGAAPTGRFSFIRKMAWRDSRASRRRLLVFSLSIVLGVAALVAVGSVGDNLRRAVDKEARSLLGADLEVSSRSRLTPEAVEFLDGLGGRQASELSFPSMVVFPTAGNGTRLVTVRGMEGGYPFYGKFLTDPPEAAARIGSGEAVVVLEETLLSQFGLKPGDPVKLGTGTFTLAGSLKQIPGDSAGLTMVSPRVIVPMERLEAAGLLGTGSLVRYRSFFAFADGVDVEALVKDLKSRFRELKLGTDTVEERKRGLGRAVESVDSLLSLVGFIALFLGGIGVASAMQVYIRQKLTSVAVLRCLGATAWQGFAVYLLQGLGIGIAGAALGVALGVALQQALPLIARPWLPFDVDFSLSWPQMLQGFVAGVVVCVLFTLLPLLPVRRVSPLSALRSGLGAAEKPDPLRWLVWAGIAGAVTIFALRLTQRWQVGAGFVVALALAFVILTLLARLTAWAARKFFPSRAPFVWRQGMASLYRPQNRTVLLLLTLGLGTFLITTMALTRSTLLGQIAGTGNGERPNLLFFDIQPDQIAPLESTLEKVGFPLLVKAPIVTMRLRSYKGRPVGEVSKDRTLTIPSWTLRREYRSTYRSTLTATELLTAGEFTGSVTPDTDPVPVSVEQGLAREMELVLGDELEFDVQGVPIKTRITSLREVDWRRMEPNFFILFPEGVLEGAPGFFVGATRVETPEASARVQQAVVSAFPNVSAIDLGLVLETLDNIFSRVQLVVQVMALFTVFTGIIVLAGAIMGGRHQRLRETVLLRTLGASQRQLTSIQLVEYGILGLLGSLVGCGLAVAANVALARWVFKAEAVLSWGVLALAVVTVTALTLLTGWLANRSVSRHPPLEILRQET